MKIWCKRTEYGLQPSSNNDDEELQLANLKFGEDYLVDVTLPRNPELLKKFFALIKLAFDNQSEFNNKTDFRSWTIMRSGFYKRKVTAKGEFYYPESISFDEMDEIKFRELYTKVYSFLLKYLDCSDYQLYEQLKQF